MTCGRHGEVVMVLGAEREEFGKKTFQLILDVCEKLVYSEQFIDDGRWKGVNWTKWREGIKGVLRNETFGKLPLA